MKCHNFGIYGHFKSECKKTKTEKAYMAEQGNDDQAQLLMLELCELMDDQDSPGQELVQPGDTPGKITEVVELVGEKVHLPQKGNSSQVNGVWYLDSGASNHMIGDVSQFFELNSGVVGTVKFGDGSTVRIKGRGTVLFETRSGEHKALTDVYFIPRLKSNIISLGQLKERGCKIVLENGHILVLGRQCLLLAHVQHARNRLYILNLDRADYGRRSMEMACKVWSPEF